MQFTIDQTAAIEKAALIKLLLLDVDGVLTDGNLFIGPDGERLKVFNTLDGHGIKQLQNAGIQVGIITGRDSDAVKYRAQELGIDILITGREDKLAAAQEIASDQNLQFTEIAYVGDDLPDLELLVQSGLSFSFPNAHSKIREVTDIETSNGGGHGAVREICDFLLSQHRA